MASSDDGYQSGRLFPLPIYYENDDSSKATITGEARGRGRSRPPFPNRGRSRGRRGGANSGGNTLSTEKNDKNFSDHRGRARGNSMRRGRGRVGFHGGLISSDGHEVQNRECSDDGRNEPVRRIRPASQDRRQRPLSRDRRQNPEITSDCFDLNNQQNVNHFKRPSNFRGKILKLLQNDDPNAVVMEIVQSRSGFVEYISKTPEPKSVFNMIDVLCKITDSNLLVHKREVMEEVEKNFLHNLTEILNKVSMKDRDTNCLWHSNDNLKKFLDNVSKLISVIITTLPSSLSKCKSVITAMKEIKEEHNITGFEVALNEVEEVFKREKHTRQRLVEENDIKTQQRNTPSGKLPGFEEMGPPPDNFREISIFPTLKELQVDEKPFLRVNKTKGNYDSLDTYLDVQFRLLREDYVQPLRKGITEYRTAIKEGVKITRLRDVRLYHGVQILRPVCSGRGINHILQFDTNNFKRVNWIASRRLLYGSLVCLSKDHFDNVYYATVTERDAKDLSDGFIQVFFEKNDMLEILPNDIFVMAETTAYFEAFRYVLEGLQEMDSNMPLQRYIINCETSLQPPKYLVYPDRQTYDFTCLFKDATQRWICPVLDTQKWPSASDLGLDSSQYEAILKATTQELSIIQGPPGTGKTFVGLKIAELLLSNTTAWKMKQGCPILVVCYTNHALDQFLEGISKFSEGKIVRIGGRSKSETLQSFILKNIKLKRKEDKKRSFSVMQSERDCRGQLKESERKIEQISNQLKKTSIKIISYKHLCHFMTEEQRNAFEYDISEDSLNDCLTLWLSFVSSYEDVSVSNKSDPERFRQVWSLAILENVQELPEHERNSLRYVWDLELSRRAELYKSWISEFKENIQVILDNESGQKEYYQSLIYNANVSILEIETLLLYISKQVTRIQVQMLIAGQVVSTSKVILSWLELSGRKEAVPLIRVALETIASHSDNKDTIKENEIENDDTDLEEERQLDDEDNFLYDYSKPEDIKRNQIKNDGEWLVSFNERKHAHKVKNMFLSAKKLNREKAELFGDVRRLPSNIRRDLYCYWVQLYRQFLKGEVKTHEEEFNKATEKLAEVRDMETLEILKEANILGMTTTGAAKYRKLLQSVRPKIIIVEEAAEVLESHIVTTLNANCQHLILIGDHKQLRPSTTVYELSKRYGMDISLFERMVRNEVPCVTLEEQHRMRPEVSVLLRHKNLYPQLRDHKSVLIYDNIKGVDENVQFIDHDEPETTQQDSTSYSNPHEAKFIAAMCLYLLNQGYFPDQITVITPYMGQVLLIRREMPKGMFDGVRITAVDNFQGEENDIILLSLVRSGSYDIRKSNRRNMIGFVGIENRICVSLSRAKKGLYVIGNFKLMEENSSMWEDMVHDMRHKGLVKSGVTLRCQNHPEQTVYAVNASDFEKVPNGGCKRPCEGKLPCGHQCPKRCHIIDSDHMKTSCLMPCNKVVCGDGHKCLQKCYQKCGKCNTFVEKTVPMCGHIANMPCHMDPSEWKCRKACTFKLTCGHSCNKACNDCTSTKIHENSCQVNVVKTLLCTHTAEMKCFEEINSYKCKVSCNEVLNCNHRCSGTCGTCFYGRIHRSCKGTCGKSLPCGHICSFPCSDVCPPCRKQCEWKCSHNTSCKRKCWEECDKCAFQCAYKCKHKKCDNECYKECSDGPCEEKCKQIMQCGHRCRGKCGETCVCIICSGKYLRNVIDDTLDTDSVFIQLPNCQCIFEIGRLDLSLQRETTSRHGDLYKHCPHCSKPITKNIKRYSNDLKKTRTKIVEKYRTFIGFEADRKKTISNMIQEFQSLKKYGLTESEFKRLIVQFQNPDNIVGLHIAAQRLEKIKTLLPILKDIKDIESSGIAFSRSMEVESLVNPQLLWETLIEGRKFTTTQFWNEVQMEIDRLQLTLRMSILQKYYAIKHKSSSIASLFKRVFEVLSNKMLNESMIHSLKKIQITLQRVKDDEAVDEKVITSLSVKLLLLKSKNDSRSAYGTFTFRQPERTRQTGQLVEIETTETAKTDESMNIDSHRSETNSSRERHSMTKYPDVSDRAENDMSRQLRDSMTSSKAAAGGLSINKEPSPDIFLGSDSYEPVSITTSQISRENESTELTSEIEIVDFETHV